MATETTALVILRRFDLDEYVRGASAFVGGLDAGDRDEWYRAFTRTAFLVGDPDRVPDRFSHLFGHRTANTAWVYASGDRDALGLRRLLKPLHTTGAPALDSVRECDLGGGAPKLVCLATRGLVLEQYLVHLNHVLCESLITGALSPDDRVLLRHDTEIETLPPDRLYVRVVHDPADPERLLVAGYVCSGDGT